VEEGSHLEKNFNMGPPPTRPDTWFNPMFEHTTSVYDFINDSPVPQTASIESVVIAASSVPEDVAYTQNIVSTYQSDVAYYLENETYEMLEETAASFDVDLTCSSSGSTSISYSLARNGENIIPTWVVINETTEKLDVEAPSVDRDTTYTFSLVTTIGVKSYPKIIYINVKDDSFELTFIEESAIRFIQGSVILT
jgi:hypothetical protein